jgi:hypothetical protein
VEVLRERQVAQERGHEGDVRPPQHGEPSLQDLGRQPRPQRQGHRCRDERAGLVAVGGELEGLGQQLRADDAADHPEDQQGVAVVRQPLGACDETPHERPADGQQDDERHHVLHRADQQPQQPVPREGQDPFDDPAGHDVGRPDREEHEPPEDPSVHEASPGVLEHLRLDEGVLDQPGEPPRDVGERAGAFGPDRGEHPQVAGHRETEERDGAPEQREDEEVPRDVGERREQRQRSPSDAASGPGPGAASPPAGPPARASWSNGPARVSSA